MRKSIFIVLIASLVASTAQATVLTDVQGGVTVNRGFGYAPAATGILIGPGDRVHAQAGSASIVYDNGCIEKVRWGQTVMVLGTPPACQTNGLGIKDGVSDSGTNPACVGAALLVGGGTAVGIVLSQPKPASP